MQPQRTGRPRSHDTAARTYDLLERISNGESLVDAARNAHVKPERVLRLLDDNAFFAVYEAIRRGDLAATAAIVKFACVESSNEPEAKAA